MNPRNTPLPLYGLIAVVTLITLGACMPDASGGIADYTVAESSRGAFPATREEVKKILETHISPNGRHIATLEYEPAKGIQNLPDDMLASRGAFVRRDGEMGAMWPEIRRNSVTWSADGRTLLYIARKDDAWHVVVNEEPGPPFTKISRASFLGPDGDYIYSAQRGDSNIVMRNGRPMAACAGAEWWWVDSSGERIACVIPKGKRWQLAVNGIETVEWDYVPFFGFSEPRGEHYFYIAHDGGKQHIVFDGKPVSSHEAIGKVLCTDAGDCFAWVLADGRWHVSRGESLGPGYDIEQIWNKELFVSPDGRRTMYITGVKVAEMKMDWMIHVDGEDFGPYDGFGTPFWGGDGERWGVIAARGQRRVAVIDGVEGKEPAAVFGDVPFFSPDGTHAGYFVQDNQGMTLILDGKRAITMDRIIGPDLSFSADSKHWAIAGKRGDTWHLVLDGELAEEGYGDVRAPGPVFGDDGTISFIARKGDEIVSVVYTPKGRGK